MITNSGKDILSKFLINQAPGYASHIAIGCGSKPLGPEEPFGNYENKKFLDFEMVRVPIISRGYVDDNGTTKLSFSAELPTSDRYEISEVGVFSAGSNPSANGNDSRSLLAFNEQELWKLNDSSGSSLSIPSISTPLDSYSVSITGAVGDGTSVTYTASEDISSYLISGFPVSVTGITPSQYNFSNLTASSTANPNEFVVTLSATGTYVSGGSLLINYNDGFFRDSESYPALKISTDNNIFYNQIRSDRYERSRVLSDALLVACNPAGEISPRSIQISGTSFNLERNAPTDEIKIAFAVSDIGKALYNVLSLTKDQEYFNTIASVSIKVDFYSGDSYATKTITLASNFDTNRYYVGSFKLSEVTTVGNFSWRNITSIKLTPFVDESYSSTDPNNQGYTYIIFDGIRIENITSISPLYGMTGYSVIKNTNAETIVKNANTSNLIEFRFSIDVSG